MIILERDGSLHHYPPKHPPAKGSQALVSLNTVKTQPSLIERMRELTFGRLKLANLEMRANEQPKR